MKHLIITITIFLFSVTAFAQDKKPEVKQPQVDTLVQTLLSREAFYNLKAYIDANIDSKKISKEILKFLDKNSQLVTKPKEQKK